MSLKNKFQNWFYLDEEEEELKEAKQQPQQQSKSEVRRPMMTEQQRPKRTKNRKPDPVRDEQTSPRIVSLQSAQKSSKVVLAEPRVYAEAQDISEHLKNKRAVVVNLQRIERDQGVRIIDFLSGTVYALGGDIQRIGTDIFLCVPENVEVAGAISDYFEQ
ncbi:cell division protein SepF [Sporosarcina pasteurii]|uniref:Cell division protein SepF n=1 Tax=Sporosarcina pasteurii TaxID=1474 RepID=A0A380BFE8_SPOPA|nr:cell division protein SepF [Sporosarcina pasteurii]MDS9470509.1 cell division protein SepF [Sporosarcina pasteurii]QBQ05795.1 cell division protein SepF [Sporosarcina pasteurii]SUJ00538.1 Cell division protein SepF [Sporosarcina pasteurii]